MDDLWFTSCTRSCCPIWSLQVLLSLLKYFRSKGCDVLRQQGWRCRNVRWNSLQVIQSCPVISEERLQQHGSRDFGRFLLFHTFSYFLYFKVLAEDQLSYGLASGSGCWSRSLLAKSNRNLSAVVARFPKEHFRGRKAIGRDTTWWIYIYIHTVHIFMCIYIYIYMCIYIYIFMCIYIYTHLYTFIYLHIIILHYVHSVDVHSIYYCTIFPVQ